MQMPCQQEPSTFCCTKPCPKKLDSCGHNCANKCGEECTTRCRKEVVKIWSLCGHKNKTQCHVDPETTECPRPCGDMLKCVHQCKGKEFSIISAKNDCAFITEKQYALIYISDALITNYPFHFTANLHGPIALNAKYCVIQYIIL